jgi:excisionase family DNA binding protein
VAEPTSPDAVLRLVAALLGEARRAAVSDGVRWTARLEGALLLASGGHSRPSLAVAGGDADDRDVLTLTYAAAAGRLGVSDRTLRRLIHAGELASVMVAGTPRIRTADLVDYVERLPVRSVALAG